jgi:cell division topological specificity factor
MMEQIKNEIIQVISKYMDIDTEGLDIQITHTESDGGNGTVPALFANIPIKDIRRK